MAWIDDRLRDHPKINRASPRALKYWLFSLCYCSQYGTAGQLDAAIKALRIPTKIVTELVHLELWDEDDDGLWVHDWQEHNEKRDQALEEKRKAARERQQRHRAKIRASRAERDTSREQSRKVTRDKRDQQRDTKRDESVTVTRGRAPARASGARPNDHDQEDKEPSVLPSVARDPADSEPQLAATNGRTDGTLEQINPTSELTRARGGDT